MSTSDGSTTSGEIVTASNCRSPLARIDDRAAAGVTLVDGFAGRLHALEAVEQPSEIGHLRLDRQTSSVLRHELGARERGGDAIDVGALVGRRVLEIVDVDDVLDRVVDDRGRSTARAARAGPSSITSTSGTGRPKWSASTCFDAGTMLFASCAMRRVRKREHCASLVDRDETSTRVPRLRRARHFGEQGVAPREGQLVAGRQVARCTRRERRVRSRSDGTSVGCGTSPGPRARVRRGALGAPDGPRRPAAPHRRAPTRATSAGATAAGRRRGMPAARGHRGFETFDPFEQRGGRRVRLHVGEPNEGGFEHDALIDGLDHGRERIAEHLDRPRDERTVEPLDRALDDGAVGIGQMVERRLHGAEEDVAQADDELLGEQARIASGVDRVGHRDEHAPGVVFGEALDDVVDGHLALGHTARGHDLLERRTASRAEPRPARIDIVDGFGSDIEARIVDDMTDVVLERCRRQQMELEVLRAAADRRDHLLGVGGREHEHHTRRRLLERLQQRGRRRVGQHVHFVEDVELRTARRREAQPVR